MKRGLLFVVIILALILVGFDFLGFAHHSWHQKMTVEVEVDGQLYSGSSVVEMSVFGHPDIPLVHGNRDLDMQGEAVVVELPKSHYLFALLTYNAFLASKVFKDSLGEAMSESGEAWASAISELRKTGNIAPKDYPLLVTFMDINDSTTVKKVDPNNLATTLGPGVSLKRITLEITDEPVTEGEIERVLGWFLNYRKNGYRLNGEKCVACPVSSENFADLIGTGGFKIGDK